MKLIEGDKLDLYFHNNIITRTEIEDFIIKKMDGCIRDKDDLLICYPNSDFFIPIFIESVLNNELNHFNEKEDPTKRTITLVITGNKKVVNIIKEIAVKIEDIFKMCKSHHQFLMENNIFCDINDPYYARIYWRHILSIYYENIIPDTVPLNYIFPISTGYHTFKQLSRGTMNKIGRKDNIQESVFLITNNINVLNHEHLFYDYVFIDFSSINKPAPKIPKGTLAFFNNPLDERISFINKVSAKRYLLDGKLLEMYKKNVVDVNSPFYRPISEMILDTNITNLRIEYVPSSFENEIEEAYILLKKLSSKKFDSYDLNILKIILYNIIKMPIEGVTYDGVAKYDLFMASRKCMKWQLKMHTYTCQIPWLTLRD
jgi:hypothetical protein